MSNAFVIDNIQTNPLHALLDPQVRPDPYGIHAELRESSPLRVDEGLVIVGDYRSCLAAMRNPALGSDTLKSSWLKGCFRNPKRRSSTPSSSWIRPTTPASGA